MFQIFKMIYISQTFDMKDIIDYVLNRIVKVYNALWAWMVVFSKSVVLTLRR